jgi:hypothetical protein
VNISQQYDVAVDDRLSRRPLIVGTRLLPSFSISSLADRGRGGNLSRMGRAEVPPIAHVDRTQDFLDYPAMKLAGTRPSWFHPLAKQIGAFVTAGGRVQGRLAAVLATDPLIINAIAKSKPSPTRNTCSLKLAARESPNSCCLGRP